MNPAVPSWNRPATADVMHHVHTHSAKGGSMFRNVRVLLAALACLVAAVAPWEVATAVTAPVEVAAPTLEPQQAAVGQPLQVIGYLGNAVDRQLALEWRTATGDWTPAGSGSTSDGYYSFTVPVPAGAGMLSWRVTASSAGETAEVTGPAELEVVPRRMRVAVRMDGAHPEVSDDGRFVAYDRGDAVFVWDRRTKASTKVRPGTGHVSVGLVSMTANGRLLLTESLMHRPGSVLTLWNPRTRIRAKVPVPRDIGAAADISPDGRFIAFSRRNLTPSGTFKDSATAFLWDRRTGRRTHLATGGVMGFTASVSRGARLVVLTDLLASKTLAWERGTGRKEMLTEQSTGRGTASPDGGYAFISTREPFSELDPDDNGSDAYLWDRTTGAMSLLSYGLPDWSTAGSVSAGGRVATIYGQVTAGNAQMSVWRRSEGAARPVGRTWISSPFGSGDDLSASGDFLAFPAASPSFAALRSQLVVQGPLENQTVLH